MRSRTPSRRRRSAQVSPLAEHESRKNTHGFCLMERAYSADELRSRNRQAKTLYRATGIMLTEAAADARAGQICQETGEWVPGGPGQHLSETGWEAAFGFDGDEEMDRAHDLHVLSQECPSFDMDRCVRRASGISETCFPAPTN
jgi:hypothetical protein